MKSSPRVLKKSLVMTTCYCSLNKKVYDKTCIKMISRKIYIKWITRFNVIFEIEIGALCYEKLSLKDKFVIKIKLKANTPKVIKSFISLKIKTQKKAIASQIICFYQRSIISFSNISCLRKKTVRWTLNLWFKKYA